MCGISGIYYKGKMGGNKAKTFEAAVSKMNESQARRGPDDKGIFIFDKGVLGHRRLSILDLSKKGKQPMSYGNLSIVFNGEIYNFLDLREGLKKKGYKFKTQTDTEVILALFTEYGEKSFGMLRGMFAFGLWDGKNKKLFLVKDRYGIKPLYYYSDSERLVFASTVGALSESGLVKKEKNPQALIGFLLFGSVPMPLATLKNILAVPAGHYLVISRDGERAIKYYDSLDYFVLKNGNFLVREDEIIGGVRKRLEESVSLHLISDAPLGVFLSGGLDSSAIAALAAEGRKDKITTLSIVFDEKEFSEEKYQRMAAAKINSDHREIRITKKDFENSFNDIFSAMDQPTIDGVNSFFIAGAAKKAGVKTVLSGLGADELFLGYPNFKKAEFLRNLQKLSGFTKGPLALLSLLGGKYSRAKYFANSDVLSFYLGLRGLFTPEETAKILGADLSEVNNFMESLITNCQLSNDQLVNLRPANLLFYLELRFYLQNQLLKDADFMSMYHSIEVRVPFLDHPLVEYLSSLSPNLKIGKEINKPLLVGSVRDLLPQEIFTRPKMGFTFPFQKWMNNATITNYQFPISKKMHWSRQWALEVLKRQKI